MLLIAQPRNGSEIRALIVAAHELEWEVIEAPQGWRLDDKFAKNHIIDASKIESMYFDKDKLVDV